jgi:hypothetical protein
MLFGLSPKELEELTKGRSPGREDTEDFRNASIKK